MALLSPGANWSSGVRAFFWMVPATFSFAALGALVKRLGGQIPNQEMVVMRSLLSFMVVIGVMAGRRLRGEGLGPFWHPRFGYVALLRGLLGYGGIVCMFLALQLLPMPVALLLSWSSVLFTTLLSRIFLRELLSGRQYFWMSMAIFGVVILLWPGDVPMSGAVSKGLSLTGIVVALAAAAQGGAAYVSIRAAGQVFGVWVILFYFSGISLVLSLVAMIAGVDGGFVFPNPSQGLELLGIGLSATLGQVAMTHAYQVAPAPLVAALNLLSPVFGAILGWYFFNETLALHQWSALGLVAIATIQLGFHGSPRGTRKS